MLIGYLHIRFELHEYLCICALFPSYLALLHDKNEAFTIHSAILAGVTEERDSANPAQVLKFSFPRSPASLNGL